MLASPNGPEGSDADDATPRDLAEVLVVQLRGRSYALPAAVVREVAPATPVTPLPGTAPWVLGIAAVRGTPLPVADLQRRAQSHADADVGAADRDAGGGLDGWMVIVDDGVRSAALVGLRVRGIALARAANDTPHVAGRPQPAPSHEELEIDGLPVRGAVRLVDEGRRGAGAGPVRLTRQARARAAATRAPTFDAPTLPELACLDVSALLDDLFEPGG